MSAAGWVTAAAVALLLGVAALPSRGRVAAILAAAAALRAWPLASALPYLRYVDEGHTLRQVMRMLATGTWDPGWYRYPSLLANATALLALPLGPVPSPPAYYDLVQPAALIVIARLLVLGAAVATVAVVIGLGTCVADRRAGLAAGILAAALPALVSRSAIVIVDTPSALFATLALWLALDIPRRGARAAAWAGSAAGLALASKYPGGAVVAAVLLMALWTPAAWTERLRRAGAALAAFVVATVVGMPALLLRASGVAEGLRVQREAYASYAATPSYLAAALWPGEAGWPLVAPAVVGLALLAWAPRSRALVAGWLVFAALLLAPLVGYGFQPFRNMLPLLPFVCVAAGSALACLVPARWPAAVPLLAAAALTATMLRWDHDVLAWQTAIVDSRSVVRAWLETNAVGGEEIVVVEELAILPTELARLRNVTVRVVPWTQVPDVLGRERAAWVVANGVPLPNVDAGRRTAWTAATAGRRVRLRAGHTPTPPGPNLWRGNDEAIVVYGAAP
jgi:4-amino-4-deoxy-L-arabinose transferase-like glycosyltransferase